MGIHRLSATGLAFAAAAALVASAQAAPPPDVYAKLKAIGRVVDAPGTTAIYSPILKGQSYDGVAFTRSQSYGPDPRALLDVATPAAKPAGLRPVLIYVPGGVGNKRLDYPGGEPFYDNIMIAAVREGMVGVNMQRRSAPGGAWDAGAHDVSNVIQWVRKNIRQYGGDPARIVIWGQSAGSNNLSNYLTHKEYWGPDGIGVKAAVLMSGGYNLAPLEPKSVNSAPRGPGDGGQAAVTRAAAAPAAAPPQVDPAVQLQRSSLPGFKTLTIPLYVTAAELDPERTVEAAEMLRQTMCDVGRCPKYQLNAQHSHMSQVMSVNSPDTSVSAPIFGWIKTVY